MPYVLKSNFARGVLTKKAQSRVDLELFGAGAAELKNFLVVPHGGIRRRSGSKYMGGAKSNSVTARLVDFIFSTDQSYVCEFGNLYVRFWSPVGGQVLDGGSPEEVVTPYTTADLPELQFFQSGDTLYIVHPDYAPRKLTRLTANTFSIALVLFYDGPYYPINDTTTTVSSSGTMTVNSTTTLTFSSTTGINNGAGFSSPADVGRHIRVRSNFWVWLQITSVTNSTTVVCDVKRIGAGETTNTSANQASSVGAWRLGLFGTTPGFPSSISIYEGRMCYGGTNDKPRIVACSQSGLPDDFAPSNADSTTTAAHAVVLDIQQGRADKILWLFEGEDRLLIGTGQSVRSLSASGSDEAMTQANVRQRRAINFGMDAVTPVAAGSNIIVAGRFGKSIRDLFFDYTVNSMVGPNISQLSEHLFKTKVRELQYAQEPESMVWALTTNGKVAGITYNRAERIIGFHEHDFGGVVESMCVVPGDDRDQLWLLVRRTINGNTVRYIEVVQRDFDEDGVEVAQADAFHVDCGGTYSGTATNTVSGATWLANTQVAILADGAVLPRVTVSAGGVLTLPNGRTATKIQFGIPMQSRAKLLRPPIQQDDGPSLMRRQRGVKVYVECESSLGVKAASGHGTPSLLNGMERKPSDPMDQAVSLRSGVFDAKLEDRWEEGGQVVIQIDDPLPAYVKAISLQVDVER